MIKGIRIGDNLPVNNSHPDILMNLTKFWKVNAKCVDCVWSWISNPYITRENEFNFAVEGFSLKARLEPAP